MAALEEFTKFGLECIQQKEAKFELRETAIGYFSEICKIMKSQMAPIFELVLTETLKSCENEDGLTEQRAAKKSEGFSLDTDSDDEEEIVGMNVDYNFIDEKASAIHAIGNLGINCPALMLPHLGTVMKSLDDLGMYFHENIRYHVCLTLTQIAFGLLRLNTGKADSDEKNHWTPGLPVQQPLPP